MNKWVKNFVEYAPDCKYVIILSSQSKISQFLFLGRKQVSEQPSRNVTVERCGNLRSENVTWEHLRNKAICEASNLFLSNTHESLVVMIYLLPGTLLEKLHGNILSTTVYQFLWWNTRRILSCLNSTFRCKICPCKVWIMFSSYVPASSFGNVAVKYVPVMLLACEHFIDYDVYQSLNPLRYILNSGIESTFLNTLRPRQNRHHFVDDIFKFFPLN